ncbi:hypothetical protein HN011_005129 [Eciton burchellii]|nr:hypothetical protein HN011_005129 [Eciton burchellii]
MHAEARDRAGTVLAVLAELPGRNNGSLLKIPQDSGPREFTIKRPKLARLAELSRLANQSQRTGNLWESLQIRLGEKSSNRAARARSRQASDPEMTSGRSPLQNPSRDGSLADRSSLSEISDIDETPRDARGPC